MPNYCVNEVKLEGAPHEIEALLDYIKESIESFKERVEEATKEKPLFLHHTRPVRRVIDFNRILPYPERYKQQDIDYQKLSQEEMLKRYDQKDNGHQWRITHWGCKWNADDTSYFNARNNILTFNTAWSPAIKIISEIHKRFPNVTMYFEYYEKGTGFIGGCEFPSEGEFDPDYHYTGKLASTLEERRSFNEPEHKLEYKAGVPMNPWHSIYMGFKGG